MKKTSNDIKSCRQILRNGWAGPTQHTRHTRSHSETAMYFVCCYAGAECRLLLRSQRGGLMEGAAPPHTAQKYRTWRALTLTYENSRCELNKQNYDVNTKQYLLIYLKNFQRQILRKDMYLNLGGIHIIRHPALHKKGGANFCRLSYMVHFYIFFIQTKKGFQI